ncbi:MAG TPA: hypothetical protein VFS51_12315, partial [Gemmatimonadales bacterium]|nr:hypothetical protein [Gemmatimonadales bacterium]
MTDLERLVRQIVRNLTATDPAGLHRPLPLSEIRDHIVPYRTNRRALELESSEDYELALMRLCAGESGFARTEPEEVRAEFAAELQGSNPDLGMLQRHGQALVHLEARALERTDPKPELAFAPPGYSDPRHGIEERTEHQEPAAPHVFPEEPGEARCTACKGVLPGGRRINF